MSKNADQPVARSTGENLEADSIQGRQSRKPNFAASADARAEAETRQSEDPMLDATISGNDTISDVNQLNAFGGDRPALGRS